MSDDRFAPDGWLWVCRACGKTAKDLYDIEGEHSPGWDESCMLNAVMCEQGLVVYAEDGRVVEIKR